MPVNRFFLFFLSQLKSQYIEKQAKTQKKRKQRSENARREKNCITQVYVYYISKENMRIERMRINTNILKLPLNILRDVISYTILHIYNCNSSCYRGWVLDMCINCD